MTPTGTSTAETLETQLDSVLHSIAQLTHRIEVIDAGIDTGTDDQNAQDERRDLQRRRDQLELRRDKLELVLPVPIFTGTLSKAEAQALMDEHKIQVLLDREDLQVLVQNNATLAKAYAIVALIAKHGP
jgi:hypothetical protein